MTTDGPPQPIEYQPRPKKRRSNRDFWSATRFLWPYRKTVAISIICALLTGALTAGGLLALVPLMNVLVGGGTIAAYADQAIAEREYAVALDFDGDHYVVRKLKSVKHPPATRPALNSDLSFDFVKDVAEHPTERTPVYLRVARSIAQHMPTDPVWAVGTMFGVLFVLGILGSITRFFQEYFSEITAIAAINDIRKKLYDRMLHLPLGYFTRHGSSDLTARLVSDAMGLQDGFKTILGKAVQEPINATFALLAAMYIDWRLTFFIIVFTPVMVTVIRKLGKRVRRAARATLERNAAMLGQIESSFVGIRVVKSTAAEPFERRRYRRVLEELRVQQNRMAKYDAWSTPLLEMLGLMAMGCVLLFATWLVFRDRSLKADELIPLMICLVAIAEPLRRISKLNAVLQKGNAAATRIFEILNEPIEIKRGVSAPITNTPERRERGTHATFESSIAFEHLTFSYPGASSPALIDVNLTIPKGTSVAIVGRNGSGKTTLLSLLPRFYEPDAGGITIDGLDVRQWPLRRLRRMIGIVTQEAVLFPGTIGQNIAYADPRQSQDRIVAAAQRAHAHEFILAKSGEYESAVEGLGGQLSGGQRQRLNIARAILRDTPILILDEATSQVDAESEHLIQGAIADLMKDRTTFVIAHRFSTILSADVIVVMEGGKIVGQGKHEDLLKTCETYKQLYERQLVG
jgi:ABC-type multidrug transport system fused ATPase/permease subunit